jgi:alpha-N-arabinofuranosidase
VYSSWNYNGSFYIHGRFDGSIKVALVSNTTGKTYAEASVDVKSQGNAWTQLQYTLQPSSDAPDTNNTLQFTMPSSSVKGPLNFNLLSLFPPTWNDRPNGNRIDLMQALVDQKPSAFRIPGGNNVEGNAPPYWWDWKKTLGPLEDRPGYPGTWGYTNTDGLGLVEYMLWAQDLGTYDGKNTTSNPFALLILLFTQELNLSSLYGLDFGLMVRTYRRMNFNHISTMLWRSSSS